MDAPKGSEVNRANVTIDLGEAFVLFFGALWRSSIETSDPIEVVQSRELGRVLSTDEIDKILRKVEEIPLKKEQGSAKAPISQTHQQYVKSRERRLKIGVREIRFAQLGDESITFSGRDQNLYERLRGGKNKVIYLEKMELDALKPRLQAISESGAKVLFVNVDSREYGYKKFQSLIGKALYNGVKVFLIGDLTWDAYRYFSGYGELEEI